jgi:hypothetical protein
MILTELTRINSLVRGNDDRRTLENLAALLTDELESYDFDTIRDALREHPRRSGWNPKLHEIVQICKEISAKRRHQKIITQASLPSRDRIPEEQVLVNRKNFINLRNILAAKKGIGHRKVDPHHAERVRAQARQILEQECDAVTQKRGKEESC